jgi:hypothetical protein
MLSDAMSKVVFWSWLSIGLLPSLLIIVGSFKGASTLSEHETSLAGKLERGEILVTQHAGLISSPIRMQFFPSVWAAAIATVGATLFLLSLAVLLHMPTQSQ